MKRKNKTGRPKRKAKGMLFKFIPSVEKYLRAESDRTGKDMVRVIEECLEYRSRFKVWPPEQQAA